MRIQLQAKVYQSGVFINLSSKNVNPLAILSHCINSAVKIITLYDSFFNNLERRNI